MKRSAVECSLLRAKAMAFKKRKDTVKKKAMELCMLCDVPVAAIVFGPNGEVETFPENQTQLKAVLQKYKDQHQAAMNDQKITKLTQKDIASDNTKSWSADSLIGLMNQLNAKIADVDHRIELLLMKSNASVQSCLGGLGVQELLAQRYWFGINEAVDQSLACGLNPWSQNLGPNNYVMVQNIVPIQVVAPAAAYPATSLGCNGNAAPGTRGTSHNNAAASTSGTSHYQDEGVASTSSTASCESFNYAEDCLLDNIELWDHDEQQLHVSDDADDDFFDFLCNYLNQEPVLLKTKFDPLLDKTVLK